MSTPDLLSLSDQALCDEIIVAREYIQAALQLRVHTPALRRSLRNMREKLALLLNEQGRRQTVDDIPW